MAFDIKTLPRHRGSKTSGRPAGRRCRISWTRSASYGKPLRLCAGTHTANRWKGLRPRADDEQTQTRSVIPEHHLDVVCSRRPKHIGSSREGISLPCSHASRESSEAADSHAHYRPTICAS